MSPIPLNQLFDLMYKAKNEHDIDALIGQYPDLFIDRNWYPLGGNESNYGVIENQQSNPVAAIVEKLTNSIDAVMMRRCYEEKISPKSEAAPRSVEAAVERFFPNHRNWDLSVNRNKQAESIQILADSLPGSQAETSLIIYDDGEGQHPEDFENTFLSLLRGNKNEIHFVQGKYNMGGSGAIVFCGKKRYQLIASRRHDKSGQFGFTLIRKHPLSVEEANIKKNTWYEYLKIDGVIPSFNIDTLDLGLHRRMFTTGTVIKLYSYDVKGNRHIRRDLSRSLNEFLYAPALPIYTVESEERYPRDNALTGVIYGLKRRLEDNNEYVEDTFSETYLDPIIGAMKVTVHVFGARAKDKSVKDTRNTIQSEFFKNNMSVLFSVNGQVHGHYTSEFITRTLQFNLLRDYLLIHVDCTAMKYDFRTELFMASRDRLKQGEESSYLRRILADNLSKGELREIYKRRKDTISVDTADDDDLLRSVADNLPLSSEIRQLLSSTFKLEANEKRGGQPKSANSSGQKQPKIEEVFKPKRFPSFFKLDLKQNGTTPVVALPLNGERTVQFSTDVENQYLDRSDEPGELRIAVLNYEPNTAQGGTASGTANSVSEVLTVTSRSPHNGHIRLILKPNENVQVGDKVRIKVDLTSPGEDFSHILWVQLAEPRSSNETPKPAPEEEKIGLPQAIKVYKEAPEGSATTWQQLGDGGIDMDFDVIMYPVIEGDVLEKIYINMDSSVLKKYKSGLRSIEQHQVADRRYVSAIFFHTLFLYAINRQRGYQFGKNNETQDAQQIELAEYLRDIFSSNYAAFLLNFGTTELIEALN